MKKLFTPIRRRKGMIDLSEIGRQEQLLYAVAHKDEWFKEKYPEAQIIDPYEEPPVEIPEWYPDTKRMSMWEIISKEALNLLKV